MHDPMTFAEIADHWGGRDCKRGMNDGVGYFVSEYGEMYRVFAAGQKFPVFEDSGRPAGTVLVPYGTFYIRCVHSAPDDWFTVPER